MLGGRCMAKSAPWATEDRAAVNAEREHLPLIRLFSKIFDRFGPFHTL